MLVLCEMYRGVSHATEMRTQDLLFETTFATLDFWIAVVDKYHDNPLLVAAVMKVSYVS